MMTSALFLIFKSGSLNEKQLKASVGFLPGAGDESKTLIRKKSSICLNSSLYCVKINVMFQLARHFIP